MATLLKDIFETEPCSRCGGSGQHSYCQMYGTRCFKCGGLGYQFTKHGAKDRQHYLDAVEAATARPAADMKVGDFVKADSTQYKYNRVVSIELRKASSTSKYDADGQPIWGQSYLVTFDKDATFSGPLGRWSQRNYEVFLDATVRIHPGAENMPKAEDFVTPKRTRKVRGTA